MQSACTVTGERNNNARVCSKLAGRIRTSNALRAATLWISVSVCKVCCCLRTTAKACCTRSDTASSSKPHCSGHCQRNSGDGLRYLLFHE